MRNGKCDERNAETQEASGYDEAGFRSFIRRALGRETGVSRQVVVQDIALLRTMGYPILSTASGYVLNESKHASRLFKVCHTNEQTEDELVTIVDLGGTVVDVMVNHRVYGKMSAPLNIKNRRDVQLFMNNIKTGKSTPLMNVTSGYHFHHVCAEQEEILDEIEEALRESTIWQSCCPMRCPTMSKQEPDMQKKTPAVNPFTAVLQSTIIRNTLKRLQNTCGQR